MKKMVIRLTSEQREQLKDALVKDASEITISYEEELSEGQLDRVQGGAVNSYLIIDGRPGPSTSKVQAIDILSFSFGQ
jgi:hypothetical protein